MSVLPLLNFFSVLKHAQVKFFSKYRPTFSQTQIITLLKQDCYLLLFIMDKVFLTEN